MTIISNGPLAEHPWQYQKQVQTSDTVSLRDPHQRVNNASVDYMIRLLIRTFHYVYLIICYYRLIAIKEAKEKSKGLHSRLSLVDNRVENRKRSNLKAAPNGGINNSTIAKSKIASDVIQETDEPFMSAEGFDFNQTIQSPYIGSPSMAGPLTRYRFSGCNNEEVNHIKK